MQRYTFVQEYSQQHVQEYSLSLFGCDRTVDQQGLDKQYTFIQKYCVAMKQNKVAMCIGVE